MTASMLPTGPRRAPAPPVAVAQRRASLPRRYAPLLVWIWTIGVVFASALLWFASERWWPATVLLYAPRWIWALPLAVLIPLAFFAGRRSVVPLVAGTALMLFALLGVRAPWSLPLQPGGTSERIRILTCNVGAGRFDATRLAALIAELQPDIVALQECTPDAARQCAPPGWTLDTDWGLCVLSRYPVARVGVLRRTPPAAWGEMCAHYRIDAPTGPYDFFNVHLTTPRSGLESLRRFSAQAPGEIAANSKERRAESRSASDFVGSNARTALIAGDFNLPVESTIYRDCWSSWRNCYGTAGWGIGNTRHTRWHGVRIDHVLVGDSWRVDRCWVGPDVGSDHRPVVADVRRTNDSL